MFCFCCRPHLVLALLSSFPFCGLQLSSRFSILRNSNSKMSVSSRITTGSGVSFDDVCKAGWTSLIPLGVCGLKWYLFLNKSDQVEWLEKMKKPSWYLQPGVKAAIDLAVNAPVGYAASVVLREARGADRQWALGLYGAGVLVYMAGIPAFVNTKDLKCWCGVSALATAITGATAAAFYKVDNNAGLMLVPLAVWMGLETISLASTIQMNPGF